MCGRFTHKFTWKELHDLLARGQWPARLALPDQPTFPFPAPSYNVAPTQTAPVIRVLAGADRRAAGLEVAALRWGLAPHWATDPKRGPINARAETVATNPMFRAAFAGRRCIVPVSGFYEWKKAAEAAGEELAHKEPAEPSGLFANEPAAAGPQRAAPKQPFYITRADSRPLLLAGLWERWGNKEECIETFTIITTTANAFMSRVHNRMPVVLEPEAAPAWLDPAAKPGGESGLLAQLRPAADGVLQMHLVGTAVNSPRNTGAHLIEPA